MRDRVFSLHPNKQQKNLQFAGINYRSVARNSRSNYLILKEKYTNRSKICFRLSLKIIQMLQKKFMTVEKYTQILRIFIMQNRRTNTTLSQKFSTTKKTATIIFSQLSTIQLIRFLMMKLQLSNSKLRICNNNKNQNK